jgi:catechol 2,3-dioxygenase-like lactoylglutathione lyase family enzyme
MGYEARVASSVVFVSRLERSIKFYREVFSCEVAIHDRDAALLLAPGGFQIYLINRGTRAPHPSGGIGLQYLIWAVESDAELREVEAALTEHGARTTAYMNGGVSFLAASDPDGIRVLVAYPSPERLHRSVLGPHLYA